MSHSGFSGLYTIPYSYIVAPRDRAGQANSARFAENPEIWSHCVTSGRHQRLIESCSSRSSLLYAVVPVEVICLLKMVKFKKKGGLRLPTTSLIRKRKLRIRATVYTLLCVCLSLSFFALRRHMYKPIPRILHFVYVSQDLPWIQPEIPEKVTMNIQAWQELHPDWEVMLWNNRKIRNTFPDIVPLLEVLYPLAWISDIVRYHVLERYGGVYLDTDIVPIHALDPILQYYSSFTVCEWPKDNDPLPANTKLSEYTISENDCGTVCTAVIGASQGHPALHHAAAVTVQDSWAELDVKRHWNRTAHKGKNWKYGPEITGPQKWTTSAKQFKVPILRQSTFFPCHWDGDKLKENTPCNPALYVNESHVYAVHLWDGSWW